MEMQTGSDSNEIVILGKCHMKGCVRVCMMCVWGGHGWEQVCKRGCIIVWAMGAAHHAAVYHTNEGVPRKCAAGEDNHSWERPGLGASGDNVSISGRSALSCLDNKSRVTRRSAWHKVVLSFSLHFWFAILVCHFWCYRAQPTMWTHHYCYHYHGNTTFHLTCFFNYNLLLSNHKCFYFLI